MFEINKKFFIVLLASLAVASSFADTIYWKGNNSDAGLGFYSEYGWDKTPELPTMSS